MWGVAAQEEMEGEMYLMQRRGRWSKGGTRTAHLMPRLESCCCRGARTGELAEGGSMPGEGMGPLLGDLRDRCRYDCCMSGLLNTNMPGRYLTRVIV